MLPAFPAGMTEVYNKAVTEAVVCYLAYTAWGHKGEFPELDSHDKKLAELLQSLRLPSLLSSLQHSPAAVDAQGRAVVGARHANASDAAAVNFKGRHARTFMTFRTFITHMHTYTYIPHARTHTHC